MVFREIIAVYFQNSLKYTAYTLCGKYAWIFNFGAGCIYSHHCALKTQVQHLVRSVCMLLLKWEQFWEFCKATLITLNFILKQDELNNSVINMKQH
jgi:hypothetical protein